MLSIDDEKLCRQSGEIMLKCLKGLSEYTDVKAMIKDMLGMILDYYGAEQIVLYEISTDENKCINTLEIHTDNCKAIAEDEKCLSDEATEAWKKMFLDRDILCFDYNTANAEERENYCKVFGGNVGTAFNTCVSVVLKNQNGSCGSITVFNPSKAFADQSFLQQMSYLLVNEVHKKRALQRLDFLIYNDELTGLRNRNSFIKYLNKADIRKINSIGIVFMDVNGLKFLNERYGQEYGDSILNFAAGVLTEFANKNRTCEGDIQIYRINGDEFVLTWENCLRSTFSEGIKALNDDLNKENGNLVTMGSIWENDIKNLTKLSEKAEQLMYIEKNAYYENDVMLHSHTQRLLNSMLKSIRNGEFIVYLQPKNSIIKNGEVYGAEALIRYVDKERGIISPYKFIKLFERERIISYIDLFVFEEVCRLLYSWRELYKKKIIVSLNFSRISLMEKGLVEKIEEICKKYDVDKNLLEIEVTETTEALDRVRMIEVVNELKSKGFRISLDDFGCEYSSMDMLLAFDVDVLKIDKSLIDEITVSNKNKILVSHICQMGSDMGVETIAEGVETKEQYNLLKLIGCACVQGYYFGKPMAISDFEQKFLCAENGQ